MLVGQESFLSGAGLAQGSYAIIEDATEVTSNSLANAGHVEPFHSSRVVSLLGHMGATNPPDKVGNRAIEIEKSSGSCSNTVRVDLRFSIPVGVKTTGSLEGDIPIVSQQVSEQSSRIVGKAERIPGVKVASQETGLPL